MPSNPHSTLHFYFNGIHTRTYTYIQSTFIREPRSKDELVPLSIIELQFFGYSRFKTDTFKSSCSLAWICFTILQKLLVSPSTKSAHICTPEAFKVTEFDVSVCYTHKGVHQPIYIYNVEGDSVSPC